MKDKKDLQKETNGTPLQYTGKTYFYLGAAVCVAGAAAFALAFSPLKIYALISSIILEIAALSFFSAQKKKYNFKFVKIFKILSYVLLAAFAAFFIGGLIYSAATAQ